ncbi:TonB-dependent receptor [Desulfobacter postgatei]|jgi:outer membrane receptor protein involved in Fe transport|uniref:TonB-dependent receptor n=1 Tax=Desulfobacter postgatei TaxID=2293 RepID=UPI002A35CD7F|nr:TonB-dependent receptor [Desulfobacter postgatei]MDX9964567.1 TonB-dependent receptor [Desulfobacter postgatei]
MNSTTVRVSFCATIILLLLYAIPVIADQVPITIKSGTLQDVLDAYSKSTGTKIVYSNGLMEGKNSPGTQNASPGDALQQILLGTGLTFQMADNNTAVLKKKKPAEKQPVAKQQENKTEESTIQQARKEIQLEEVTVSAQKTEENVLDVPISMSVFDDFTIQDRMIDTVQDIAKYTPGLEIINLGCAVKSSPAIRGLYSGYEAKSSTAGLYIDGIPVTDGTGFDESLMDIERVEVLKGPQGTLYGKNTEVGVINIITKKPDNETKGKVVATAGSDSKKELAFSASGPVVKDRLYIGVSGKYYEKEGFIYNASKDKTEDDRKHNYGKINFRWTPTDNLEASLIYSKIKYDNGANAAGLATDKDRVVFSDLDTFNKNEVVTSQ